ncbi:group 1 truncated hemoglobin [Hymenobacter sp. HSC-4F20]|uniref:group I truncated hemoglobin n=1 Tax=Hymenobacter sp. HSC-4F20 TaxID=2864135 RepID=UPI001C7352E7|nr:group 1 truncated hemoglobin [Hymenobacter sp. HSC-4F20]MBX0291178.1 group 1 truncated hemoglobin [Hymenobacter sp. HSC-4F20]
MFLPRLQFPTVLLLAGTLCFTTACGSKEADPAPTLYERMGGLKGVEGFVDVLMANVAAETEVKNSQMLRTHTPLLTDPDKPARLARLRNNFINQMGEATGGPLKYTGMTMLAAHKGMMITETEWAVWRQAADASMAANNLGAKEKAELATILDEMKAATVGH